MNLPWNKLKPLTRFQFGLATIGILSLLTLVPLLAFFNSEEGHRRANLASHTKVNPLDHIKNRDFDGLLIIGNITSVDTAGYSTKVSAYINHILIHIDFIYNHSVW